MAGYIRALEDAVVEETPTFLTRGEARLLWGRRRQFFLEDTVGAAGAASADAAPLHPLAREAAFMQEAFRGTGNRSAETSMTSTAVQTVRSRPDTRTLASQTSRQQEGPVPMACDSTAVQTLRRRPDTRTLAIQTGSQPLNPPPMELDDFLDDEVPAEDFGAQAGESFAEEEETLRSFGLKPGDSGWPCHKDLDPPEEGKCHCHLSQVRGGSAGRK